MSNLRNQLDLARQIHLGSKYPGDLAGALLHTRQHRPYRLVMGTLIGSAIAATIALAIYLHTPASPAPNPVASNTIKSNLAVTVQSSSTSTTESVPYDSALVPPGFDLTPPSLPSIPSWEAIQEIKTTSTATTKESA